MEGKKRNVAQKQKMKGEDVNNVCNENLGLINSMPENFYCPSNSM